MHVVAGRSPALARAGYLLSSYQEGVDLRCAATLNCFMFLSSEIRFLISKLQNRYFASSAMVLFGALCDVLVRVIRR